MKFRFARHTNNLENIKSFYINVLGFELLGEFKNHAGYNGIFIGKPNLDWHLEFTVSDDEIIHSFNEDDILVFYPETAEDYKLNIENIQKQNICFINAKNPYWDENGKMILDPDGYRIVISNSKLKTSF
ncbi:MULTISPECIES: VOC family protein [Flavobacterium]|uniref:VOC family protein n=1 Tax=Flavobacterium jumunjinense TaxID=998845 RepID=A0ABV5GR13_9FLAO|nr:MULTISPECIES: VOC family protein [Flavobacterium]